MITVKPSQGFALITVLWITAFLAVIAGSVSYQARASLGLASNTVASFKTKHAALFMAVGVDEKRSALIAGATGDWRDQDNLKRVDGAEDQDYIAQGLAYEVKDDEFDSIDELSLVFGMTPEIFNRVKPYVTVYAQDLGVNTALASSVVKNAVQGVTESGSSEVQPSDYVTGTGGLIYTLRVKASDPNGHSTEITSIIRLQRGNTFEPFTILGWKQS